MKWELPKLTNRPAPRFWRIECISERYNFTEDKYNFSGVTTPYNGIRSKHEAICILDRIEQDAEERISRISEKSGEYALRVSTEDLHVCIYGNKMHFTIKSNNK